MKSKILISTWIACDHYSKMLKNKGIIPKEETNSGGTSLPHVYWMLETLKENIENKNHKFDEGKVSRWLGFIQAILILNDLTTVEKERNFTRPLFS